MSHISAEGKTSCSPFILTYDALYAGDLVSVTKIGKECFVNNELNSDFFIVAF